jgi:hypothetical protein
MNVIPFGGIVNNLIAVLPVLSLLTDQLSFNFVNGAILFCILISAIKLKYQVLCRTRRRCEL